MPLAWERMVIDGSKSGLSDNRHQRVPKGRPAHEVERKLRRVVAQVLDECVMTHIAHYESHPVIRELGVLVRTRETQVLDFNFDSMLLSCLVNSNLPEAQGPNRTRRRGFPGRNVDRIHLFRS